jgi:hypothetical protein
MPKPAGHLRSTLTVVSFAFLVFASAAAATIDTRGRIEVEFLADGRCSVLATGEAFHSSLTYTPQTVAPTADRRCAIPPVPEGTPVDLIVSMPHGAPRPPGEADPRLSWTQEGDRWVGVAALTTAPLLVRLPTSRDHADLRDRALHTGALCSAAALVFAWLLWRRGRAA